MTPNEQAFLDMLAWSEGTDNGRQPTKNKGYDVLVGGGLSTSYADHPRRLIDLGHGLFSTAAGRYQLLARYFDVYKVQLKLPDFSPRSQDLIALQQVKECGALPEIDAGNIEKAIEQCAHIWASLPGNTYGQRQNAVTALLNKYAEAGGSLVA